MVNGDMCQPLPVPTGSRVKSMTGYGQYTEQIGGLSVTVEIKAVNHRYFEFSSRLPRGYGFLDEKLKRWLQSGVARGKIDVGVWIDTLDAPGTHVMVNHAVAAAYLEASRELEQKYRLVNDLTVRSLAMLPEVLTVRKTAAEEDEIWDAVCPVAAQALERFNAMRLREGERLSADILSRRAAILRGVAFIEERAPLMVEAHMEKVRQRMSELLETVTVDEARLLNEAAIFADRVAVAEETVRLRSHLDQLEGLLRGGEAIGRKLDFLVQEINREVNTIGSKAQDVTLTRQVVDMKAEIEKIREQLQNIE